MRQAGSDGNKASNRRRTPLASNPPTRQLTNNGGSDERTSKRNLFGGVRICHTVVCVCHDNGRAMKNVFRTPSGIECGILYQPPRKNLVESHDSQLIQRALLNKKDRSFLTVLLSFLGV